MPTSDDLTGGDRQNKAIQMTRRIALGMVALGVFNLAVVFYYGDSFPGLTKVHTVGMLSVGVIVFALFAVEPRLILHNVAYQDRDER